ncbi:hypothetical protein G9A89_014571 [Geosiphon pyriformis]|nr:hypothetical protein G9A89_014571 [Geosiphon pyriformis]
MFGAIFKIKLAHVKTVFQSVHGFLGAKSVLKDNVKLFCVKFASQVFLEAAFLIELTSSICLVIFKIAKFLVVPESGSLFAVVALCNVLLGVFAADIKTALSVFGVITCVVLKPAGIWQYIVVYFENLVAATSALNHWSVLMSKDKIGHLAVDYKIASPPLLKASKMFKPHFVGSLSYVKTSVSPVLSEFSLLVIAALPIAVVDSLPIGSMIKVFEQFVNSDLVSSSPLNIKVNKVLVHISIFSRAVDKLE